MLTELPTLSLQCGRGAGNSRLSAVARQQADPLPDQLLRRSAVVHEAEVTPGMSGSPVMTLGYKGIGVVSSGPHLVDQQHVNVWRMA
jgi:hypothetical protein